MLKIGKYNRRYLFPVTCPVCGGKTISPWVFFYRLRCLVGNDHRRRASVRVLPATSSGLVGLLKKNGYKLSACREPATQDRNREVLMVRKKVSINTAQGAALKYTWHFRLSSNQCSPWPSSQKVFSGLLKPPPCWAAIFHFYNHVGQRVSNFSCNCPKTVQNEPPLWKSSVRKRTVPRNIFKFQVKYIIMKVFGQCKKCI